jgi:polyether ionophore transport system permease protein
VTAASGTARAAAPRSPISWTSRLYGFGSIYAKTLRDSRLALIIVNGLLGGVMLAVGAGLGGVLGSAESRADLVRVAADIPPILQGITGRAVNVGTIGGYMTWKYGPIFMVTAALWSILALSGTLAAEAQRGSLDFIAAAPFGKRRIALEKLAAHLTGMLIALVVLAAAAWVVGAAFGSLPADAIPVSAAVGFALQVGLIALASSSVAFALAPFLGRAGAVGIAGFVLFAGYLLNGYQASVPVFSPIAALSWFDWTAGHVPLAGQFDWLSLVPVAIVAAVLFAVGVEAFARRDLGATSTIRSPRLPGTVLGLRGPVGRALGERLPTGLAWGLGLGIFGLVIAAASRSLADTFATMSPDTLKVFRDLLPDFDITTAGGFLQFVFVQIGSIVIGFGAATLVAGWASDETSGRLELLLSTPLARRAWAVRSGLGVYLAITVITFVLMLGVGIGAAVAGSDALTPMLGSLVLGLYAAALAGVGLAIGGLFRASIAGEIVAVLVILTFLVDLVVPALKLPEWVHQLALTAHLGQPMVGTWDAAGIATCLVLAAAGLLLGGWGVGRRDIAR